MLDSKYLRSELKETAERLATRNYKLDVEKLTKLEEMRKDLMVRTQDLQAKRNSMSKSIGQAKREGKDITEIKNEVAKIGDELDVVTSKSLFNRNPNMTIYIGLAFGNRLYQSIENKYLLNRSSIMYGVNTGITYNVNDWFAIDIGYRYLKGFGFRESHDVLFGTRFTLL